MIPEQFISPEKFRYNPVSPKYLYECTEKFKENFEKYKEVVEDMFKSYSTEMRINYPMVYRIIERIDQRRDYYLYFHSNHDHAMYMSQAKETALFCYWLIKYKPISFENSYEEFNFFSENGYTVNELYTAFLLMSFITGLDDSNIKYFNEEAIFTLTYSLTNREISKEALILYVESFLTQELNVGEIHA